MENTKRMREECKASYTKSLAMITNYVILEKQHNGTMKVKSNIRDVFVIKMTTMHCLDTSRRQDIVLLGNEWNFWTWAKNMLQENEKIFLFIDIYAAKDGVMNQRDGTQKDTCWNTIIPIINKFWSWHFQGIYRLP